MMHLFNNRESMEAACRTKEIELLENELATIKLKLEKAETTARGVWLFNRLTNMPFGINVEAEEGSTKLLLGDIINISNYNGFLCLSGSKGCDLVDEVRLYENGYIIAISESHTYNLTFAPDKWTKFLALDAWSGVSVLDIK